MKKQVFPPNALISPLQASEVTRVKMQKVLILYIPGYSHTIAILGLVKELINDNFEVTVYTTHRCLDLLKDLKCEIRFYNNEELFDNIVPGINTMIFGSNLMHASLYFLDTYLEEIKQLNPDIIIHESMCLWGKCLKEITGIKTASMTVTFAFKDGIITLPRSKKQQEMIFDSEQEKLLEFQKYSNLMKKKYGLNFEKDTLRNTFSDIFINYEELNLIFISDYIHPYKDKYDSSFKFVGPSTIQKYELTKKEERLIYISLGTMHALVKDFFEKCIRCFENTEYQVVISTGNRDVNLSNTASNISIKQFVNQQKILSRAALFICHGGINSINEAVIYDTPFIMVPVQSEQYVVAKQFSDMGIAPIINLQKCTEKMIMNQIQAILNENQYKENFRKYRDIIKSQNGNKKAVEEIKNMI